MIRGALKKHGWPEDLVIGIEATTLDKSKELIKQVDLILATGGGPMVKAAYSSGKPAQGVGAGNAMIIVDETADLKDAADKIMRSKTFDTSCSTEKLSVTMTLYKYKEFSEAIDLVNRITAHSGPGHSCGIHTANELRIKELSHQVKVSRIMVRQPQCLANSGAWTNGLAALFWVLTLRQRRGVGNHPGLPHPDLGRGRC